MPSTLPQTTEAPDSRRPATGEVPPPAAPAAGTESAAAPYLVLAGCLALAAPLFFLRGIGVFDDSMYLKLGEMVADGAVPYRDFWENKTPGIFYFAGLIALVGRGHWLAPRVVLFLFAALFGACVVAFTRRRFGRREALWAAWIFVPSFVLSQGFSLHTDHVCAFFGFAALAAVCGARRASVWNWGFAGALVGLAFLFKQAAVLYLGGAGLFALSAVLVGGSWRDALLRGVLLTAGFAAVLLLGVGLALWSGVWEDCYDAVIVYARLHAVLPFNWASAWRLWVRIPAVPLTGLALVLLLLSGRVRSAVLRAASAPDFLLFALVGLVSLVPTLRLNNHTGHYAAAAVPELAVVAAVVLAAGAGLLPAGRRWADLAARALPAMLCAPYLAAILWAGWVVVRDDRLRADLRQQAEIRAVLDARLPPDKPILCLSGFHAPRLYLMSGRRPAIKYLYFPWKVSGKIQLADAVAMLDAGQVKAAIVDIPAKGAADDWPAWFTPADLRRLEATFEYVPLRQERSPSVDGRVFVLVSRSAAGAGPRQ